MTSPSYDFSEPRFVPGVGIVYPPAPAAVEKVETLREEIAAEEAQLAQAEAAETEPTTEPQE